MRCARCALAFPSNVSVGLACRSYDGLGGGSVGNSHQRRLIASTFEPPTAQAENFGRAAHGHRAADWRNAGHTVRVGRIEEERRGISRMVGVTQSKMKINGRQPCLVEGGMASARVARSGW